MGLESGWEIVDAIGSLAGGLAAFGALFVAWFQLRGFVQSSHEATRPYVSIDVVFERQSSVDPKAAFHALAYVVVRNDGRSAARDIVLESKPPFKTLSPHVTPNAAESLRELFSGEKTIASLNPGRELKYILDDAREVMRDDAVRSYEILAGYLDPSGRRYRETLVIDLEAWQWSAAEENPLNRISRDLQGITRAIEKRE